MRFFICKHDPGEHWDYREHRSVLSDEWTWWGPIRSHRDDLAPGGIILMYDTKAREVWGAVEALPWDDGSMFQWGDYRTKGGDIKEGWGFRGRLVGFGPTHVTAREFEAIAGPLNAKGFRTHARISFKPIHERLGRGLYERVGHGSARHPRRKRRG